MAADALAKARAAGNPRAVNVLLLGMLSQFVDLRQEQWHQAIKERVPAKTVESNLKAFTRGFDLAQG